MATRTADTAQRALPSCTRRAVGTLPSSSPLDHAVDVRDMLAAPLERSDSAAPALPSCPSESHTTARRCVCGSLEFESLHHHIIRFCHRFQLTLGLIHKSHFTRGRREQGLRWQHVQVHPPPSRGPRIPAYQRPSLSHIHSCVLMSSRNSCLAYDGCSSEWRLA